MQLTNSFRIAQTVFETKGLSHKLRQISVVIPMGAHGWGLATVYQVKNSFVRISNISPILSHFKFVFSYVVNSLWR